ncbi:unnamed protein product [Parascedosporium putredinis]|uniref:Rhodopsin domain-containing protein n=1 Tax=Parascedosporium putredinis TaxID=1442378 RepID=A0A9P1MGA0_9PEZI|nr:unnamed protein product [Parascedosporium putredinis]CAI8004049.1 unnamed protein product [Parascedosporium putredinis]
MATAELPVKGQYPELDAETRVPILVGISIAFALASTIAVLLRLYTRTFILRTLGWDDATIAFAQVLSIGVSIITILQAKYALGIHVWMTTEDGSMDQLKALFAGMVIYNLSQIVTKISFLLQYRRIFEGRTRVVSLILLIFLAAWGVTQEVLVGMSCIPVAIFIPSQADKCIDALTVWYLTSIMNIVTDFMVFATPMPAVRKLRLKRKKKLMVLSIFGLGFFTCVISIVRLFTLRSAINTQDPTWDNVPTSYLTVVELNCGILCACLPTLRPLIRKLFPRLLANEETNNTPNKARSKPADIYTLTEITHSGSAEALKENAATYEGSEYANYPGKNTRLTTSIYGRKSGAQPNRGHGQAIEVTTEIGMEESTKSVNSSIRHHT